MIRRWMDAMLRHFIDTEWLHERRKQEVLSRRETHHIVRGLNRTATGNIVEDEIFPSRKPNGGRT